MKYEVDKEELEIILNSIIEESIKYDDYNSDKPSYFHCIYCDSFDKNIEYIEHHPSCLCVMAKEMLKDINKT